ncbi:STAS domain-containing protein [Rhodococcus sp. C26F]
MNQHSVGEPQLVLTTRRIGTVTVLSVRGELDLTNLSQFERYADGVLESDPTGLIIDLTDSNFLASMGITVLIRLSWRCADRVGFAVVAHSGVMARRFELLGLLDVLAVHREMDQALAAVTSTPPMP